MGNYELILFDLDGTLLDTLEDLADSVNYVMKKYGYEKHTLEEVRSFVGDGIKKLLERSLPDGVQETILENAFLDFMSYYKENCKKKTKPYDGICELIKNLKKEGWKLAVVSNKNYAAVNELVPFYFPDLFDIAVGEREGINKKPAPDTVFYALDKLGVKAENAVYIGDSDVDVKTAENAGTEGIFVTWGFRTREELKAAGRKDMRIADTAEELYEEIKNMNTILIKY